MEILTKHLKIFIFKIISK